MSQKLKDQENQLKEGIGGLREGLKNLQSRTETIIKNLEAKNDESEDVDLSDEIAELGALSSGINEMFPVEAEEAETEATESTATTEEAAEEAAEEATV